MKIKDYTCPGCGAPLKPAEGSSTIKCEYCGHVLILEGEDARKKRLQDAAFAREHAKYKVQEERERTDRLRKVKKRIIIIAVIFGIVAVTAAFNFLSRPVCDPFEYVTVEFSGTNGSGRAEISAKGNNEIDTNLIDYSLSSEYDLSEGDMITLSASSSAYRLSSKTKKIEVTGLDLYLTELNPLSDEMLEIIHKKSDEICDRNIYGYSGLDEKNTIISREPVCMYLCTDGKNNNILHDISKLVISNYEGEEKTVYISAYYEDIIVRDGEEKSFNYDRCMYCGNQIWLGNNVLHDALIDGFESLESVETHIRTTLESDMKIIRRDI